MSNNMKPTIMEVFSNPPQKSIYMYIVIVIWQVNHRQLLGYHY